MLILKPKGQLPTAMAKPNDQEQVKAVLHIRDFLSNSKDLSETHKSRMLAVYEAWATFTGVRAAEWNTAFKVNKAHQIVETVMPRLVAKDPKWIVSARKPDLDPEYAVAIQDYLTYIFDEYNLMESVRLWAKSGIIYGNAYAKVKYKYETARIVDREGNVEIEQGGESGAGESVEKVENVKFKEEVVGEYPTIENVSWTDIHLDPRYPIMEDMPGVAMRANGVRIADLMKNDLYFNLDKVEDLGNLQEFKDDENGYKNRVFGITGMTNVTTSTIVDPNSLTVNTYYGVFNKDENNDPEKEKLYEIKVVDDLVVVYMEEITTMPFEDWKAFEDPEQHYAVGFVEPIIQLQDEMNFKKNSASSYINNSLNRSWLWSPNSGVNPADLISKPNNIIVATQGVQKAKSELEELPHRALTNDFFQEENDFERQIQAMSFTVDTSNPRNQQALTNTATGARIKFFESNSVINEVRKHFEEALARLAYKLLQTTADHLEDNIVIKKMGKEGYWQMNKEMMYDALTKYSIKIEANSSSFDDVDSRREDAIAFFNIMKEAFAAQLVTPQAMKEALRDVIGTFEKKDVNKFIGTPELGGFLQEQAKQGNIGALPQPETAPSSPEALTKQVAGGQLTN